MQKIHLIAIGGAAMHNLALALHHKGHQVSGSDDEIYDPSRSRLAAQGLLPKEIGWHTDRITPDLDAIIVGMHARKDNPELAKAKELGIKIYSYPEYVYQQSINKKRVVIAGSHGKTTTTAMVLHVLNFCGIDTDYLVGAQLDGFDRMVRLSDAPIIVIEGDEYLASPLVPFPKIHFYYPHITAITGIAWDHINVFPTFDNYVSQFDIYLNKIEDGGKVYYYSGDKELRKLAKKHKDRLEIKRYNAHTSEIINNITFLKTNTHRYPIQVFGNHNLQNIEAARRLCKNLGVSNPQFYEAMQSFGGAAKRMQKVVERANSVAFLDFAHAPSKVKATIAAMKDQFPKRHLTACFELHTFSSLNKNFHKEYNYAMQKADTAVVYFNEHTLKMKRMPELSKEAVAKAFRHPNIKVFTETEALVAYLEKQKWEHHNLLMMSSGTFGGLKIKNFIQSLIT